MTILLQGDAHKVLKLIPDETVHTCITSPPYWMQRDYGVAGQIGREQTIQEYLERLWEVFNEVWRVLRVDGTCWINLGDKYHDKCAGLLPERLAIGMVDRGWTLRNKIIWHKKSCKPESVKSRFTMDWEPIYFFSKCKNHYFAQQYEPYSPDTLTRCKQYFDNKESFDPTRHKHDEHDPNQAPFRVLERIAKNLYIPGQTPNGLHIARANGDCRDVFSKLGRNMRSVWTLPTAQYRGAHFASWSSKLVSRMIQAGCPQGGVVLDPFVGSGTTLAVAETFGCSGIGIDICGDYLELSKQRILQSRNSRDTEQDTPNGDSIVRN